MGSLTSAIAPIWDIGSSIASGVGSVASFVQPFVNDTAQNRRDAAELKGLETEVNAKKAQNLLDYQTTESARRAKLRAALATQRARFGGAGLDANDGSGEAVLGAMTDAADLERKGAEANLNAANAALDLKLSEAQKLNLLDRQSRTQKTILTALGGR